MRRKVGFALLVFGLSVLAWAGVSLRWGDPLTSIYTAHEQRVLAGQLAKEQRSWLASPVRARALVDKSATVSAARIIKLRAQRFALRLHDGAPIGRIVIPKLGLNMIVVEGTSERDLAKGPGHYNAASGVATALPGTGGVVAIAGHRTTFLHPFRYVDRLRSGDNVYLEMPYGTLRYRIYFRKIVAATDWSILGGRPYEKLVLSACHPLYSATHRIVIFARLAGASTKSSL
ncbi:MAG TPA: class D sortase [Gaiellaceae bacterium]|nr:class D sortase [Gaiellaceae bacterium]